MQFATSCPSLFQQRSESNKSKSALIGPESIFHFPKERFSPSNVLFLGGSKLFLGKLAKTVLTAEEMLRDWEAETFGGFWVFSYLVPAQFEDKLLPSAQKNTVSTSAPVPWAHRLG